MEHLLEAICRGGTSCTTYCEWCARTHFLDHEGYHGDYEDGELEELRKNKDLQLRPLLRYLRLLTL